MYALQDYIGEDSVNMALKRLLEDWNDRIDLYPTTKAFNQRIREVTPDSLQYIITDMFETITLFENKVEEISYSKVSNGFEVELDIISSKLRADSVGNETEIKINDWIDIGVYAQDSEGEDSLIYLKKHFITKKESKLIIKVKTEPFKAGIDPLNILIDRHPDDNVKAALKQE